MSSVARFAITASLCLGVAACADHATEDADASTPPRDAEASDLAPVADAVSEAVSADLVSDASVDRASRDTAADGAPDLDAGGDGDGDATADAGPPAATVKVTSDWTTFVALLKPYGKLDEPSLGGFEYLISAKSGFEGNDQTINIGDETLPTTAIGADLGGVAELSGVSFELSVTHVAGKNVSFRLTSSATSVSSVLCWGSDCPPGAAATPTLDGKPPITSFNGLQLQLRAQDVAGSSATLTNLQLHGVAISGDSDPLLDVTVTPSTPSTIPLDPSGRVGQWILAPELAVVDWELTGTVTLTRPDDATSDLSKVRFVIDYVTDTRLPLATP